MEKDNKYYNVIANIVKSHKKYPGLEEILDDIIDDVYSHSEVILNTVSNESVIDAYLEKVVSTSIITVPKRLGFHNNANNVSLNLQHSPVDKSLVDRMINGSQEELSKNTVQEIKNKVETSDVEINTTTLHLNVDDNSKDNIEELSKTEKNSDNLDRSIVDFSSDNDMSDLYNSLDITSPEDSLEISGETLEQEVASNESLVIADNDAEENSINPAEDELLSKNMQTDALDADSSTDTSINTDDDMIDLSQFTEESKSVKELELEDINHENNDIEYKKEDENLSAEPTEIEESDTDNIIDLNSFSLENSEAQPELVLEETDVEESVTLDQDQVIDTKPEEPETLFLQEENDDIEDSNETIDINSDELEEAANNDTTEESSSEESLDDVIVENNSDSSSDLDLDTNSNVFDDNSANKDEFSLENNVNDSVDILNEETNLDEDLTLDLSEDDTLIQASEDELDSEFIEENTSSDLLELDSSDGDILEEYAPPINEKENQNASKEDFVPTNYSMFSYKPDAEEMNNDIDADSIAKEIVELANKNQKFDIIKIYNLKYKEKETIPKIASELQMNESDVIEALNEIIAVL